MTIKELCNEWIEINHKDSVKRQTYIKYKCIINNYILPAIGDRDIETFTRRDVQLFMNDLKKTKGNRTGRLLSPAIQNNTLTVLRLIFAYAVDFDLLGSVPTDRIKCVKKTFSNQIKCFTIEEQKKIEAFCYGKNDIEWFGIILALYTGLRIGELLALEWQDINFKTGILKVNKTAYVTLDDDMVWREMVDTPKTRTSNREIPLPAFLLVLLVKYKNSSGSARVISHDNGDEMKSRTYRSRYNRMLETLNISHLPFHTLRHTFATRAIESGMDVKTLSEILGHSNPTITLNIYTHAMNDHKIAAMQLLKPLVVN